MKIKTPPVTRVKRDRGRTLEDSRKRFISAYVRTFLGYDISGLITTWEKIFLHVAKHQGTLAAVKTGKDWYTVALRRAAGLSFEAIPYTKTDKSGFPKVLTSFKKLLEGSSPNGKRAALTVLQLYKLWKPQGKYSLQSITAPWTGSIPQGFMEEYDRTLDRMFPPDLLYDRISSLRPAFHVSGRNGPNGPMLGTAFVDREAIRGTNIESNIRLLCRHVQDYQLLGILDQSRAASNVTHNRGEKPLHSRIRIKYESGGKSRPFAIVDFFSQSALKSIHQFLMNWLEGQESDGTSSHSFAAKAVKEWTGSSVPCWSFDLTSATDRWPIILIHRMMIKALGQEIADSWKMVISDRTFTGPSGEEVKWAVGQPLGALSSWASFAVSHHAFLRTCEVLARKKSRRPPLGRKRPDRRRPLLPSKYYRIIGDDVTIAYHEKIALQYREALTSFGLEISIPKSVVPEQASKPAAELAKRLFVLGVELTPVPPEAILEYSKPYGIRSLLESSLERGYLAAGSPYPVQSIPHTREEWSLLTFPLRNALPQLNGVKCIFPWLKDDEDPPAGLNPNWFYWLDTPIENLRSLFQEFILKEVSKAEVEAYQMIRSMSFTTGPQNPLEKSLPQGGDWQPGPARCHPQIVLTVLRDVSLRLQDLSFSFGDPNQPVEDLYKEIGRFHVFLEPKLIVYGRKSIDQKTLTRRVLQKVVRYCVRNKDRSFEEPYFDEFPGSSV